MTLPASEETVPATDEQIAKLEQLATITDMCGHDASVLALIARIRAEIEDANIGRSIISAIGREVSDPTSPLHNWSPAEHYDEVITDLVEMVHEARERAVRECAEIAATEKRKRLKNAEEAKNGSVAWGDPEAVYVAQSHKAITAGTIEKAILSLSQVSAKT